jgi:hypothetical protein
MGRVMEWSTITEVRQADGNPSFFDVKVGIITLRCPDEKSAWTLKEAIDNGVMSIE